ncbi:MAG: hypothetical protein ABSE68_03065 [Minisyncoccia bacterium]
MSSEHYSTHSDFRKKRSRLRFWIVLGSLFFLLACVIGLLYFILNSPWLTVKNFSAPDLPGASGEEILSALKTQMAGSRLGAWLGPDNILFWKLSGLPENIHKFPGINNISDEVDLFSRSVKLNAERRKLWGIICGASGGCYGLDENGTIFSNVPDVSGSLLLKISDSNIRMFLLGQPLFSNSEWFSNIKSAIEALNRNNLKVAGVELKTLLFREWTAKIANGPEIYFSLDFTPADFDSILKNLKTKIDFSKVPFIDFRVPNRIYYK